MKKSKQNLYVGDPSRPPCKLLYVDNKNKFVVLETNEKYKFVRNLDEFKTYWTQKIC